MELFAKFENTKNNITRIYTDNHGFFVEVYKCEKDLYSIFKCDKYGFQTGATYFETTFEKAKKRANDLLPY